MDAYEVHKKIQEAILAVEIYQLKTSIQPSAWHAEILKGLDELSKLRQTLDRVNKPAGRIKISHV